MSDSVRLLITKTSYYALNRLEKHASFQVHSVYRKTINLHANGNLVAIQAEGSPLSPVSLITNLSQAQMEQLPVFEGQTVYMRGNHLIFCKQGDMTAPLFAFSFKEASVSDTKLPAFRFLKDRTCIHSLESLIHQMITDAGTSGIDLVFSGSPLLKSNLIMSVASERIQDSARLFAQKDYPSAASQLIRLIGLGIGLTPSGDDFTTGVLAGFILFDLTDHPFSNHYKQEVISHLFDTNDVSRTFLTAALDGHFSNAVNSLAHIKKEDLSQDISAISSSLLNKFLAIGHSSGIDALCGIYFVLKYIYSIS